MSGLINFVFECQYNVLHYRLPVVLLRFYPLAVSLFIKKCFSFSNNGNTSTTLSGVKANRLSKMLNTIMVLRQAKYVVKYLLSVFSVKRNKTVIRKMYP